IHPRLAEQHGIQTGDRVTVTSRRSAITLEAMVVKTIRPDTVFIPYHWPHDRSANNMTSRAIDPVSHIPEYKICAVRLLKVSRPSDAMAAVPQQAGGLG